MTVKRIVPAKIVKDCWDCPMCRWPGDYDTKEFVWCKHSGKEIHPDYSSYTGEIPDWCPLEKAEE